MKILLYSQNVADKTFLSDVAQKADMGFILASKMDVIVEELQKDPMVFLFVDASSQLLYSSFENTLSEKFGLYSAVLNPNYIFYIDARPLYAHAQLSTSQIMGSFFQRNYHQEDKDFFALVLRRLSGETPFGIENYFSPLAKQQASQIKRSIEKTAAIEGIRNYLKRWGMNTRASGYVASCVDELLIHALFEAPVDQLGKPLYAHIPRNTPMDLNEGNYLTVKVVHDDLRLGVSISDKYASLDRSRLFAYLGKSFRTEEYKPKNLVSGLDLGLPNAYHYSSGYIMAFEPGTRCEMMVFFRKSFSFRDYRDQFRFVSTQLVGG